MKKNLNYLIEKIIDFDSEHEEIPSSLDDIAGEAGEIISDFAKSSIDSLEWYDMLKPILMKIAKGLVDNEANFKDFNIMSSINDLGLSDSEKETVYAYCDRGGELYPERLSSGYEAACEMTEEIVRFARPMIYDAFYKMYLDDYSDDMKIPAEDYVDNYYLDMYECIDIYREDIKKYLETKGFEFIDE